MVRQRRSDMPQTGQSRKPRKRAYYSLDLFKYISALLVVAIHVNPFSDLSETFNAYFIADVARLAVPFFFACSAFLHFQKRKSLNQVNLIRYEKRIGLLYLVWSVIYLPYILYSIFSADSLWIGFIREVRDFFFTGSYYHLWFLPALMFGMFLLYEMIRRLSFSISALICLILYLVGYLINIFGALWLNVPLLNLIYNMYIGIFSTARNGLFFAPVFLLIGYLLANTRRMNMKAAMLGFIFSYILLIAEVYLYMKLGLYNDLSCMFLSLIPLTYFLMTVLLNLKLKRRPIYAELRKESTIIYTSHILFVMPLFILFPQAHLVVYLLSLALSTFLAYLISRYSRSAPLLRIFF